MLSSKAKDPLDKAIDDVIQAAMRLEYYRHFGHRGDGKNVEAKDDLKVARVALKTLIKTLQQLPPSRTGKAQTKDKTMTNTPAPIDVWFKFENDTDEEPTHEANTYMTENGYVVEWYLNSVGMVTSLEFDTLADAYDWYEREGFQNFTA